MSPKAYIILGGRSMKEIEVFGGEVYVDIDGRNVGKLVNKDIRMEIDPGQHKFKMAKTHTYGTFIGIAEAEINIKPDEELLLKYTPPMLITQPGVITITSYENKDLEARISEGQDTPIIQSLKEKEEKQKADSEKRMNGVIIFVIIIVVYIIIQIIWLSDL